MKRNMIFLMVFLLSLTLNSQVINEDNPRKGHWDFKPEKIWEVDKAGENEFGVIAELLVSDSSKIYVRDFKHNISYIFKENGQFLGSFAKQGTEKGELSRYLNRFKAENKIVLGTPEKLHFFSEDGVFETSYKNNLFIRFPLVFLNQKEFIYAPTFPQSPVSQKKLMLFDLLSGEDKLVVDFSQTKNAEKSTPLALMVRIFGLTPQVSLAACEDNICFGRSDQYTLYMADLKGNEHLSFKLDRQRKDVSLEDKKNHLIGSKIPQDRIDTLVEQLPDKMTYFSKITIIDGLIYVYAVDTIERNQTKQKIDIFSSDGRYLFRGVLTFEKNQKFSSPSNLVLCKKYLYVIHTTQDGRQKLAKYRITHPEY
ncbi:MAG: hypothetical protein JXB26_06635 [Candidatus Aminicenantes bacterium]|nr:hypothetical protein [Candidatus Aminicenantes bacterium]